MASIYRNGSLTIAAAASHDGREGCFRANHLPLHRSLEIPIQINGQTVPSIFARIGMHEESGILLNRAWVLQEQLLSRRILYFKQHELAWGCTTLPAGNCECSQEHPLRDWRLEGSHDDDWKEIVVRYSRRKLTKASDKSPALSGIAQAYREACNSDQLRLSRTQYGILWTVWESHGERPPPGTYYAGLWEGLFLKQITWYVERRSVSSPETISRAILVLGVGGR